MERNITGGIKDFSRGGDWYLGVVETMRHASPKVPRKCSNLRIGTLMKNVTQKYM